jgi:hypothetical protein
VDSDSHHMLVLRGLIDLRPLGANWRHIPRRAPDLWSVQVLWCKRDLPLVHRLPLLAISSKEVKKRGGHLRR